jgi:hypothetical protein
MVDDCVGMKEDLIGENSTSGALDRVTAWVGLLNAHPIVEIAFRDHGIHRSFESFSCLYSGSDTRPTKKPPSPTSFCQFFLLCPTVFDALSTCLIGRGVYAYHVPEHTTSTADAQFIYFQYLENRGQAPHSPIFGIRPRPDPSLPKLHPQLTPVGKKWPSAGSRARCSARLPP